MLNPCETSGTTQNKVVPFRGSEVNLKSPKRTGWSSSSSSLMGAGLREGLESMQQGGPQFETRHSKREGQPRDARPVGDTSLRHVTRNAKANRETPGQLETRV